MKDYASMSDFEINKAVFLKTQYYDEVIDKPVRDGASVHWGDGCNWREFDPCNNPADAWPIITDSMISIRPVGNDGQLWEASGMAGMKADYDKNPLRSAMIVFLMMKESE